MLFLLAGAIGTDRVMRWDEVTRLVLPSPCTPADLPLGRRDLDGRPARLALARELLGRLKELPDDRCAEAVVAERTGRPAVAFADPNGGYDAAGAGIAGEEGISLAFTMDPGPARMPDALRAPPAIPRIGLDARDTFDAFRLEVPGGLAAARGALAALRPRGRR